MSKLAFFSVFVVSLSVSFSQVCFANLNCSSNANLPGSTVTLNCTAGNCSGWTSPQSLNADGACSSSTTLFKAYGTLDQMYVSGHCNGGAILVYVNPVSIPLRGSCSNGGAFYGTTQMQSSVANGSCQENGATFLFIPGMNASMSGICTQ